MWENRLSYRIVSKNKRRVVMKMPKYKVTVTDRIEFYYEIDAEDEDEAFNIASSKFGRDMRDSSNWCENYEIHEG
jgi:hypothetical protein